MAVLFSRAYQARTLLVTVPWFLMESRFGVPAVLGTMAMVRALGLVVTLPFGREDTEH